MSLHRDDHLGELATALVDGELDHQTRDIALAHLAGCAQCRREVEAERRLKAMLGGAPDPGMPPDLTNQLLDIGRVTGGGDRRTGVVPWIPEMARFGRSAAASGAGGSRAPRRSPRSSRPGGAPPPANRSAAERRHRTRRLVGRVAGGVTALAIGVGVVAVAVPHNGTAPVTPAVTTFTVQHAATTGDLPGADPAAGAVVTVSTGR